jgi:cytoskeletal protein CcmA (bactofilin family)
MFGRDKGKAVLEETPPPMPAAPAPPAPASNESVLGPTLTMKGEITFEGGLRVEGEVTGSITGQGRLTVAKGGRVMGDIISAVVVIEGKVYGNVTAADRMEIAEAAEIVGDIKATRVVIAEGSKILGRLDINSDSLPPPPDTGGNGRMKARAAEAPAAADALNHVL